MESKQHRGKKRRIKKPKTFSQKLGGLFNSQLGKNEKGEYQWEVVIGIALLIVIAIVFIIYIYLVVLQNSKQI